MRPIETDYLVVGAGAMGMAFTDALVDHADVHVTLVDRRYAVGGHWRDAYPFVRLHQASQFYGVASVRLGDGARQTSGPETGLHERATVSEILAYYDRVLERRLLRSGKVDFRGGVEHRDENGRHLLVSALTGETREVVVRRRVVDASYVAPAIPATSPPPFAVDGARTVPVGALPGVVDAPSEFVIVGSGKTATDAIVWLLGQGLDPDRIVWVRPRDPWMLDRARVQPGPLAMATLAADTMEAAAGAGSLEELFLRLEAADVLLRIDPSQDTTMARTPTLARWELDLLRTVTRVVRLGHVRSVGAGELVLAGGTVPLAADALVVHCASYGLSQPPLVPIWQPDAIRIQTHRAGFPCFCAALVGYVEATRDDDRERNHLCPPNILPNTLADWARMQVRGGVAAARFGAEPDIAEWSSATTLDPATGTVEEAQRAALRAAEGRLEDHRERGARRLAELSGEPLVVG